MERVYGELGREFIHVHHITPLSELGGPAPVDPAKDLVPLCPNCHAIVHRRRPPYTLDELRKALGRS
jgi:5-methylcytosine-specific restriction protein A